jgi:serine/threonine protein phosphatase PrpC
MTDTAEKYQSVRVSQRGDRKINQDRCDIFEHEGITVLALADGMGGHPKGEVAAQIFIDTAYQHLKKYTAENFDPNVYIADVMRRAHKNIIKFGIEKRPPIYPRSTAVVVVIVGARMYWSHLGDSRTYLFRHGRAHMRTMDHTRAEIMRLTGKIADSDAQAVASGRSGVAKCLGGLKKANDIEITPPLELQSGDIILLCTDGVWSQLKNQELEDIVLNASMDFPERISDLVDNAVKAAHPNSDNATVLALFWNMNSNKNTTGPNNQNAEDDDVDIALDNLRNLIDKYN